MIEYIIGRFVIKNRMVFSRDNGSLMGTLFDKKEYDPVMNQLKASERDAERLLEKILGILK